MKLTLKNSAIWFCFGFLFVSGAFVGAVIYDKIQSKIYEWRNTPYSVEYIHYPEEAKIVSMKRIDAPNYTIAGEVENTGSYMWVSLGFLANIYAGESLMNECKGGVMEIPPAQKVSFKLECETTHGDNLPDNISHKIVIYQGYSKVVEGKHNK